MSCPLCGTQINRHFHYSRSTTDEEGQFWFKLSPQSKLQLDYRVRQGGESVPHHGQYDTITLGRGDDIGDLFELTSSFPDGMGNLGQNPKVAFEESEKAATFRSSEGGIVLRYLKSKPFDRIVFEDVASRRAYFSIPTTVFSNELVNALKEMRSARDAVEKWEGVYDTSTEP